MSTWKDLVIEFHTYGPGEITNPVTHRRRVDCFKRHGNLTFCAVQGTDTDVHPSDDDEFRSVDFVPAVGMSFDVEFEVGESSSPGLFKWTRNLPDSLGIPMKLLERRIIGIANVEMVNPK